jgi:hypothetical protein
MAFLRSFYVADDIWRFAWSLVGLDITGQGGESRDGAPVAVTAASHDGGSVT